MVPLQINVVESLLYKGKVRIKGEINMKQKATIILLIVIVLLCELFFSGCSRKVEQKNNELTVYIGVQCRGMLELAVDIFRQKYPDVEVHVIDGYFTTDDELMNEAERMATELMAGEGPDVFLFQTRWDAEKMIDMKVFADLSPFFDDDPYFQGDNWNQKIFEGGCRGNYRYAIPTEYGIPVLVSSEEAIIESGIDVSKMTDFNAFMDETEKYMGRIQGDENSRKLFRMSQLPIHCLFWSGYPVLNWENETVDLESEQMKRFFEWYWKAEQRVEEDYTAGAISDSSGIRDGQLVFGNRAGKGSFDTVLLESRFISSYDKPVMVPVRNYNGGINAYIVAPLAVRANSENLLNAYRFIQIYMSTEVQTSVACWTLGSYKVNREAQEHCYEVYKGNSFGQEHNGFPAECPPFSREEYEELIGYIEEIDIVMGYDRNIKWVSMLREQMQPYVNGECTYEEAIAQAKYELEIYVSE